MNWILQETREIIKNKIKQCKGFMEVCEMQLKGYKDQFNTDDKNEACSNSYWRASKIRVAYEIKDLKEMLQEIDEMMQEEDKIINEQIRKFELAEEKKKKKRENAKYGI